MDDEEERVEEPEGMENIRTESFQSAKQGIYKLTETESVSTGPTWVYTRSSEYML